jgi:hypothetical protein
MLPGATSRRNYVGNSKPERDVNTHLGVIQPPTLLSVEARPVYLPTLARPPPPHCLGPFSSAETPFALPQLFPSPLTLCLPQLLASITTPSLVTPRTPSHTVRVVDIRALPSPPLTPSPTHNPSSPAGAGTPPIPPTSPLNTPPGPLLFQAIVTHPRPTSDREGSLLCQICTTQV